MMPNVNRFGQRTEFCTQCGAGLGQFRRDGEGTCPECDPPRPKPEVLDNGRKIVYPIWRDDLAEATIL